MKTKAKSKALRCLYDRYIGEDAERAQVYEQEELNSEIAREVGLSQRELAN